MDKHVLKNGKVNQEICWLFEVPFTWIYKHCFSWWIKVDRVWQVKFRAIVKFEAVKGFGVLLPFVFGLIIA